MGFYPDREVFHQSREKIRYVSEFRSDVDFVRAEKDPLRKKTDSRYCRSGMYKDSKIRIKIYTKK